MGIDIQNQSVIIMPEVEISQRIKGGEIMSYSKLRGKIREVYKRNEDFANAMNMDPSSLSAKLNNGSPWKREEIEKACELLHIPIEEVYLYFFYRKS